MVSKARSSYLNPWVWVLIYVPVSYLDCLPFNLFSVSSQWALKLTVHLSDRERFSSSFLNLNYFGILQVCIKINKIVPKPPIPSLHLEQSSIHSSGNCKEMINWKNSVISKMDGVRASGMGRRKLTWFKAPQGV